jgi:GT2 family glycosyltransferase
MPPAISVVLPSFNRERVLGRAMGSVLEQRYGDLELIVVDDGSSDGTRALVESVSATDVRVHYHHQPNAGAAAARNAGLDLATGAFVAFLDSDDSWKPWHLELAMAALDRLPEAGLIWTDVDAVDVAGTVVGEGHLPRLLSAYGHFTKDELFATSIALAELGVEIPTEYRDRRAYVGDVFSPMIMGNLVLTSSVLMRRERLVQVGRFDEHFETGEDYEFFLRACRAGPVAFADIADVRYNVGTADRLSGPAMSLPMARAYLAVLQRTLDRDSERITLSPALLAEARAYAYRWVGEAALQAGSGRLARKHLARAFRIGPRRPWILLLLALSLLPQSVVRGVIQVRRRLAGARREAA